jgi:hypothetical protein
VLEIPPTPGLEVRRFCHSKRNREASEEVAVVLPIGHALRAHEVLRCPDALPGLLEVVHRLFEDGIFAGHDLCIRTGSVLRSPDCFAFFREFPHQCREDGAVSLVTSLGSCGPAEQSGGFQVPRGCCRASVRSRMSSLTPSRA